MEGASGRTSAAVARLIGAAIGGHEHPRAETDALYAALRFGADPRQVVRLLRAHAGRVQTDLLPIYLAHAQARVDGDGDRELQVANDFAALGLDLYAAEAAAHAARTLARQGPPASAQRAAALAARSAAACEGALMPALDLAPAFSALTPRELEIASLAARGMANRAIADALVISVRTVESCVLRACRKLGVASRRELADVLPVTAVAPAPG